MFSFSALGRCRKVARKFSSRCLASVAGRGGGGGRGEGMERGPGGRGGLVPAEAWVGFT